MIDQPTGTVTFLFTDIEGSTKRWERQPEAMARAVARHDELMRAAIVEHHGHVFKTVGDAFCAAFPSPADAVAAMLAAQRAIANEPWGDIGPIRVRTALHTGEAEIRDADYFGPSVNRTARLVSAGHGGQMLVSSATGEYVAERLPTDTRLRSLGKHRLKDLSRPERILQVIANGLPTDFPHLKTVPSPTAGIIAAAMSTLLALVSFRVGNRSSEEGLSPALLSPLSLYTGFKGLVLELSTLNEYVLLVVGGLLLAAGLGIAFARWRRVRRELAMRGKDAGHVSAWVVNQRTAAFFVLLSLLILGAYGYQQYLWHVALPIPDDALGIAMTREASAATVQDQLADVLYAQGQAEQVIIRELPVRFDARDTDKAREIGRRIGAKAVIIYRADAAGNDGSKQYTAYVVFTDPSVGLTIGAASNVAAGGAAPSADQTIREKEGVPVPVLKTDSLDELINAAAGIIAYDHDEARKAIEYLQLAMPREENAPNTGIVSFYLGNAYNLDNQPELAAIAYEKAAAFYRQRTADGEIPGPQDQLIMVKTELERGQVAAYQGNWDLALSWYQRALDPRSDLLAHADSLERPTDVHATYARLFTLMADAYRFKGMSEDQRAWTQRATEEIGTLSAAAAPTDGYALVQESSSLFFAGDCAGAMRVLNSAIALDPADSQALMNAGIISLSQQRPDLAQGYWQNIIQHHPQDIEARQILASASVLQGLGADYFEPAYLMQAETYEREIIGLDPANLYAHEALASLAALRASATIMDSTALTTNDAFSVAKSQYAWPLVPARRQAALDDYQAIIDERRLIANELQPGDVTAQVEVAEAYLQRQMLNFSVVVNLVISGQDNPDFAAMGEQILADATQINHWTDRVLANPGATRLERIRAWAARLEASEREWSWYAYFGDDAAKAADLEARHRGSIERAVKFVESEPVGSVDEIAPARIIYYKALFITQFVDGDATAGAELQGKIDDLTQKEHDLRKQDAVHYATFCTEERELQAANDLLATDDTTGAQAHLDLALAANPQHVATLRAYGKLLYQAGDLTGAIARATAATDAAPDLPGAWIDLTVYSMAAGDATTGMAAFDHLAQLSSGRPAQATLAALNSLISQLSDLTGKYPKSLPDAIQLTSRIGLALDGMSAGDTGNYQYPQAYASLGKFLLAADQPAQAEPLLRRSLELDPHQFDAAAELAISVLVQQRDATNEVSKLIAEVEDPFWSQVIGYDNPDHNLKRIQRVIDWYLKQFPDREATLEPLSAKIDAERTKQGISPDNLSG